LYEIRNWPLGALILTKKEMVAGGGTTDEQKRGSEFPLNVKNWSLL